MTWEELMRQLSKRSRQRTVSPRTAYERKRRRQIAKASRKRNR